MRGNFYDWKITVCSPKDLNFPEDLFSNYMAHGQEKINSVYLEGFKDEWAFPLYGKDNKNRFTIEIKDEYELYTFFYLLKGQISVEEEIVISDSEKWAMYNKF